MNAWLRIIHHKAETYRWDLLMAIVYTVISVVAVYVFWWAVLGTGGRVPGWSLKDLVFFALLMDFAAYLDGIFYTFTPTSGMIRRGELASFLVKPVPIWLAIFPYQLDAEDVYATVLKGLLVFVAGLFLGYSSFLLVAGMLLVVAGVLLESLAYSVVMFSNFFLGDARPLVRAYDDVWGSAKAYPVDAYRKSFLYWVLVVLIPLYFMGTLPMHVILGMWDNMVFFLPVLIAVWLLVVKAIWRAGLRRWESYGG